jgi:hypothetical protein
LLREMRDTVSSTSAGRARCFDAEFTEFLRLSAKEAGIWLARDTCDILQALTDIRAAFSDMAGTRLLILQDFYTLCLHCQTFDRAALQLRA